VCQCGGVGGGRGRGCLDILQVIGCLDVSNRTWPHGRDREVPFHCKVQSCSEIYIYGHSAERSDGPLITLAIVTP